MGHDANRLVHQFESSFALADRLDWVSPEVSGTVQRNEHIQALPLVDQAQVSLVAQVQASAQLTETLAAAAVEEAIVGSRRHASEIPLHRAK